MASRYDLAALAREVHVSTRTLLRRFGADTGGTPLAYLQEARVRRASHLLESTDRTVAGIASDVGYQDTASFSRLFTRHTGRAPSAYRAQFRRSSDRHDVPGRRRNLMRARTKPVEPGGSFTGSGRLPDRD